MSDEVPETVSDEIGSIDLTRAENLLFNAEDMRLFEAMKELDKSTSSDASDASMRIFQQANRAEDGDFRTRSQQPTLAGKKENQKNLLTAI